MKTTAYNPSLIEIELGNAIANVQREIESKLHDTKISHIYSDLTQDNPVLKFLLVDKDGDQHEVAVRIVQVPDKY